MLFEILTGYLPFRGETLQQMQQSCINGNINWPHQGAQHLSQLAADLVSSLLTVPVETRLGTSGAAAVREHGFFEDVLWDSLLQYSMPRPIERGPAGGAELGSATASGASTRPAASCALPAAHGAGRTLSRGGSGSVSGASGARARTMSHGGSGSAGASAEEGGKLGSPGKAPLWEGASRGGVSMSSCSSLEIGRMGSQDGAGGEGAGGEGACSRSEIGRSSQGSDFGEPPMSPLLRPLQGSEQLLNFDYMNLSNLEQINEGIEGQLGSVSYSERCKECKWYLSRLNLGWISDADFRAPHVFTPTQLPRAPCAPLELPFKENLVRISQCAREEAPQQLQHAHAHYAQGQWLEIWFRNECPAHWGTFSYAHWWKGLSIAYEAPAPDGSLGGGAAARQQVYSYCELEHEAGGPALTVGLWRMQLPPDEKLADMSVLICFAKAKALGVKRIVHRVSIPLTQLLGQKTEISWITDGNW